ncbi:MAG: winged helix-turn-helix domain-containing protein [Thermoplasmatota archaeon]
MTPSAFDIYQTNGGYTTVTNEVQRDILAALEKGEKQLPELVEITGRSKPTLSSLHMKELLNRELIEERPHPTDGRRKVYRLLASRIGSSEIPVDQLRTAVRRYAGGPAPTPGHPLAQTFLVLAAAPEEAAPATLAAQAKALGRLFRPSEENKRQNAMAILGDLERQGVARVQQLDLQQQAFTCGPGSAMAELDLERLGILLAGFLEGSLEGTFEAQPNGMAIRLSRRPS